MDECSKFLSAGDHSRGSLEKTLTVNDKLIDSLKKKLDDDSKKIHGQSIPCIYSVPEKLRTKKKSDYSPYIISIGPHYYKHDEVLKGMEVHKINYMHCLFKRTVIPSQKMEECVDAIAILNARSSYASSFSQYSDVEFIEMMIVDGCFILELLCRSHFNHKDKGDPFFGNHLVSDDVKHDLLLLENQIPYFVLETLFKVTLMEIQYSHRLPRLIHLILKFFHNASIFNNDPELKISKEQEEKGDVTHILGLIYMCNVPYLPVEEKDTYETANYSATDLDRAGVNFMAYKGKKMIHVEFNTSCWFDSLCGKKCPSDIPEYCVFKRNRSCCFVCQFCQLFGKTRFAITPLCIHDDTESLLRNLIAYEQCYFPMVGYHITSYAYLMDKLINDEQDVQLLQRKEVLRSYLGSPKEAVDLFNNLCKEVIINPFLFKEQWEQVEEYRSRIWPSHIALIKRTYFNTPWSGIVFVVGVFIAICQFIVTFKSLG